MSAVAVSTQRAAAAAVGEAWRRVDPRWRAQRAPYGCGGGERDGGSGSGLSHTRALHAIATSSPPPSAAPVIAATVGLGPASSAAVSGPFRSSNDTPADWICTRRPSR
jgi:hypothetical protein